MAVPDSPLYEHHTGGSTLGALRALVLMTRPAQIALIAVVYLNGVLLAVSRVETAAVDAVALGSVLVVLVAMAVHLANEAADKETDELSRRTPFSGGSGALAASGLDARVPLAVALGISAVVVATTLATTASGRLTATAATLLLLGHAGGLLYSLPPVAIMRRGLGEPFNALLGAMLLPLFGVAVVAGTIGRADILAFLSFFFVALASVMATAWPDRHADAATGKRTMQVRLSVTTLRRIHLGATLAFVLATVASAALGAMPLALLGLLVAPLLVLGVARYTRQRSPWPNVAAMVGLALITTAALALAVWA